MNTRATHTNLFVNKRWSLLVAPSVRQLSAGYSQISSISLMACEHPRFIMFTQREAAHLTSAPSSLDVKRACRVLVLLPETALRPVQVTLINVTYHASAPKLHVLRTFLLFLHYAIHGYTPGDRPGQSM